jgi:hypothetical protein
MVQLVAKKRRRGASNQKEGLRDSLFLAFVARCTHLPRTLLYAASVPAPGIVRTIVCGKMRKNMLMFANVFLQSANDNSEQKREQGGREKRGRRKRLIVPRRKIPPSLSPPKLVCPARCRRTKT